MSGSRAHASRWARTASPGAAAFPRLFAASGGGVAAACAVAGSIASAGFSRPSPAATCDLSYALAVEDTSVFQVRVSFAATHRPQRLFLPETSPGGLRETYARFVEGMTAETETGEAVPTRRVGASRWEVDAAVGRCVVVSYDVRRHADDPIRLVSNDLTPTDAYFVGATTLVGVDGLTSAPATLVVRAPDDWSVWTTLPSEGDATFTASSYGELARAPVLMGTGRSRDVVVPGGVLRLVSLGAPDDSVVDAMAGRFAEIADCQVRIFGAPAAERTLVGVRWRHDLDLGGGVARRDAVMLNIGREWMDDPGRFASATFAHEHFHTWNFGVFHPADGLWRPFGPTATRSLWLVEGLTDYYVIQTFVRLGRLAPDAALSWLSSQVASLESSPARDWASLEDGGPMADAGAGGLLDVRAGGLVAGFVLDVLIRYETAGRSSLDHVVRVLAEEAFAPGYTSEDVARVLRDVGGGRVAEAYRRFVTEPGSPNYSTMLEGTPYRIRPEPARPDGGAREWIVERNPEAGKTAGTADVLGTGCNVSG